MDALTAIATRRSIRQYTTTPVPDDVIETLVRAAMSAPSACNQQLWEFVLITDRSLLDRVAELHPNCQMARQAPVGFLVCANLQRETCEGYWPQDCAAAIQNLLIAANALGLGAVWTGIYPRMQRVAAFRSAFGIPEHVVPVAMVPVGYPAEHPGPADRYDPVRVHRDRW